MSEFFALLAGTFAAAKRGDGTAVCGPMGRAKEGATP